MNCYALLYIVFIVSSLYSCKSYKQVEEMVILHLFIEHHYKSIVSIIRERHVLTLHLSTANCRRKLTTGCCCKNAAALYCTLCNFCQIESIPQFLKLWPISMHFDGTLILLYFIEMLPRTVSNYTLIIDEVSPKESQVLTYLLEEGTITDNEFEYIAGKYLSCYNWAIGSLS